MNTTKNPLSFASAVILLTIAGGCALALPYKPGAYPPPIDFDDSILTGNAAIIFLGTTEKTNYPTANRSVKGFAQGFEKYIGQHAPSWTIYREGMPKKNISHFRVELNYREREKMKDPFRCRGEFSTVGLKPIKIQVDMQSALRGSMIKGMNNTNQHHNLGILTARELLEQLTKAHMAKLEKEKTPSSEIVSVKGTDLSSDQVFPRKQPQIHIKPLGVHWAVIVGISEYRDSRIPPLRYASADAGSFYEWAVSPGGGKYSPANVKCFIDREATASNIKEALFNWLRQALEEDTVVIYFACHGSPDSPDSPENLYLLPYDSQYDKISTTGFPMWDIETALKRFVKAKTVVVIADACHSGGVGQEFDIVRRSNRGITVNPISAGVQNLSQINEGICVLSASDNRQLSRESMKWGGGHGVFTYFLLKGLKGEADYNQDRAVTLGELIPFLSQQVRRETKNAQSPTVAGKFDPGLRIAR